MQEKFKVGDEVFWDSQANAGHLRKEGKIVFVVPSKIFPLNYTIVADATIWNYAPIDLRSLPRQHESYLVAVEQPSKAKPKLYLPRVSALRKKIS